MIPYDHQNVMCQSIQGMKYVTNYLDGMLMLICSSIKDQLIKLEMVTAGHVIVPNLSSLQDKLSVRQWNNRITEKYSNTL
jgi:hypothetical protein